ncbi:hypothetical protein [Streptomyces sp. M7]|uniref:hypothetical protein n=1 Tax=Streptomyces sp. M7 TaxID=255705 RepID=UPI000E1D19ED|nr:hypothetical protein [Streptomyces sp. M7]RDS60757.1 hypothetical protein DWC19_34510 [Streptomyces sp. M7]
MRVRSIVVLVAAAAMGWGSTGTATAAAEQRPVLSVPLHGHASHDLVERAVERLCRHSGTRVQLPPFARLCMPVNGWQ